MANGPFIFADVLDFKCLQEIVVNKRFKKFSLKKCIFKERLEQGYNARQVN